MIEKNLMQQTTTMVMLPQTEWEGMKSDLQELKELVRVKSSEELNAQWIESTEARKLLGVSQRLGRDIEIIELFHLFKLAGKSM